MSTNFQKVCDFNQSFGLPHFDTPQPEITKTDEKLTKLRFDLIAEEVDELKEAIKNHDFVEITDALADILYVVYGAGSSFGIDLDKAFDLVHESNMSKLCSTEQEAKDTVQWYEQTQTKYDSPAYRKSKHGDYWVVYNKSTGKILKSILYQPVSFKEMGDAFVPKE